MSIDLIRRSLSTGGEHLGDLVFWSLSEARIDRVQLESIWSQAQLDPGLLPDAPSAEKAIKLAVRESATGHPDRLIRLGKECDAEIIYNVVREQRHGDGSLDYSTEARITLDREREVFSSDRPGHDLVEAVHLRFDTYRSSHHPDDVRRTIVKTLGSLAAVTLRDGGGVYYVPSPHADKVRRLQSAVEKIGSSRVYLLPVHKSAESSSALGEIARGSIEEELASLKSEIASFVETPPSRASTLVHRFDAFEALRARAKMYRSVLAVEVADLDTTLNKLSNTVEQLLAEKADKAAA